MWRCDIGHDASCPYKPNCPVEQPTTYKTTPLDTIAVFADMLVSSVNPGFSATLRRHLNFFRIHLLFLYAHASNITTPTCLTLISSTFTPLICSGALYASNGKYPIAYIDALYNSVSAVTVCGLGTVNMSQLTVWQQVLLFIQMCVGSPVSKVHNNTTEEEHSKGT